MQIIHPQIILDIVREAGKEILKIYHAYSHHTHTANDIVLPLKSDASPVTKADIASHEIISLKLKEFFPDIPVVSEEDETSWHLRETHEIFWLVDPLDGTKEFIEHNDEFTVNVALVKNGIAEFGVIFAPVLNEMYWGVKSIGAFREKAGISESIHVSTLNENIPIRVLISKRHFGTKTREFIAREKFPSYTLIRAGSSLKFCRLAEGKGDVYPRLGPTCEWDTAAGQAIVEAAGGFMTQLDGMPLTYGKKEILNPFFIAFCKGVQFYS